jgi:hypothetical protein
LLCFHKFNLYRYAGADELQRLADSYACCVCLDRRKDTAGLLYKLRIQLDP